MADPDLTDSIDVDALAHLLATPTFDVAACRERIARYVREGDGEAGRGIEKIAEAFKARAGESLDHKRAFIAALAFTRRGTYSADVCHRVLFVFGRAIWHQSEWSHLFDVEPYAICQLMQALHPHAGADAAGVDRAGRDLMSWVELGDRDARARLEPIVARAALFPLDNVGDTIDVGGRLLDVLTFDLPRLEDKLARILANAEAQISREPHLFAIAGFLALHGGRRDTPNYKHTIHTDEPERTWARQTFGVFWHLVRDHRSLFERHIDLFARWGANSQRALELLAFVDDTADVKKAGARGQPWRIIRAGRVLMTTTGDALTYLPKFTAVACATEAAATKAFASKLAAKRAGPTSAKPRKAKARPG